MDILGPRPPAPKPHAAPGDLVAIGLRTPDGHVVGRVVDAHQSIFLLHRNTRGSLTFEHTEFEVWAGHIGTIVHADPDAPLSQALERLWLVTDGWAAPGRQAKAPRQPKPLTHRIHLPDCRQG